MANRVSATAETGWMSRVSRLVSDHPIAAAIGAVCVAGGVWLVCDVLAAPDRVFKEDADDEAEEEAGSTAGSTMDAASKAEAVAAVADAVRRADVCNRFTRKQLLALYKDWTREYKSQSLTLVQFATVFAKMGVKDERVIRSMFEAWDTDQSGTVDFSELLHAIAITAGGSLEDKLTLCFRAFDLNGDGAVSPSELGHFFASTREALGKPVDAADVRNRVAAVFSLCDENGDGFITEDEFRTAAMRNNFFKRGGLFEDFEAAMKLFFAR